MDNFKNIISLNIETSGTLCSVALGIDDRCVDCIEADDGEYHSERLHVFVGDLLQRNKIDIRQLSVIAVSYGPGSYTGLRIGAAAAKTLAYALKIPLVTLSSLHIQALNYAAKNIHSYIASTMQARGKKIYLGIYSADGKEILPAQSFIVSDENIQKLEEQFSPLVYIGSGAVFMNERASDSAVKPSARGMIKEVFVRYQQQQFSDIVYFEPMYI